jgi:hypothetical protein
MKRRSFLKFIGFLPSLVLTAEECKEIICLQDNNAIKRICDLEKEWTPGHTKGFAEALQKYNDTYGDALRARREVNFKDVSVINE